LLLGRVCLLSFFLFPEKKLCIYAYDTRHTFLHPRIILILVRFFKPGARFSKRLETIRARKAIYSSCVSNNGEVCTPDTTCMKGTSVHIKNMSIKQLCNRKVRDFAMALWARKVSGGFQKRAPGPKIEDWC